MTPPSPLPWKWDKLANGACRVFIGDQPIVVENGPDAELIVKSVNGFEEAERLRNLFPKLVDALEATVKQASHVRFESRAEDFAEHPKHCFRCKAEEVLHEARGGAK